MQKYILILLLIISTNWSAAQYQVYTSTDRNEENWIKINDHKYLHFDNYSSIFDKLFINFPHQGLSDNSVWKHRYFPIQVILDGKIADMTFGNYSSSFSYFNISIFDLNNDLVYYKPFTKSTVTLTNLTISSELNFGSGNITFDISVLFRDEENNTKIEAKKIVKQINWDLSTQAEKIVQLDWSYIDYNYWGPNPGWRVIIDNNTTLFKYVSDRDNRNSYDELKNSFNVVPTNQKIWEEIEEFSLNQNMNRWEDMVLRDSWGQADGPAYQYKGILKFQSSTNLIFQDFDDTDGTAGRTWMSHSKQFEQFKELMDRVLMDANQTYNKSFSSNKNNVNSSFLQLSGPSLPIIFITLSIIVISTKKKFIK